MIRPADTLIDLVRRTQAGDDEAFEQIASQFHGWLVNTVHRFVSRTGAPWDECFQQGRVELWQAVLAVDTNRCDGEAAAFIHKRLRQRRRIVEGEEAQP